MPLVKFLILNTLNNDSFYTNNFNYEDICIIIFWK